MTEWGTKPTGLIQVDETKEVYPGDIYGMKAKIRLPNLPFIGIALELLEGKILNAIKQKIEARGDTPLYIYVEAEQHILTADLNVEVYAQKGDDPIPITVILYIVTGVLIGLGIEHTLEWVAYFWKGAPKPTPPTTPPGEQPEKPSLFAGLSGLLLIIIILYALSKQKR